MTNAQAKIRTLRIVRALVAAGHVGAADEVRNAMMRWAPKGNTCAAYGIAVARKFALL